MVRPGLVCIVAGLVLLAGRAGAEEPPRLALSFGLSFHLRHALPAVHVDEELPDLDEVLHPGASYLSDVPPAPPERVPRWYGESLLLVDPASLSILLTGEQRGNDALVGIGIAGILLSGPLVHGSYGHPERGFVGLLLRAGAALAGNIAGGSVGGRTGSMIGGTVGYLGAVAFDGVYLCRDLVDEEDADAPGITPEVSLAASGGSLGLAGRF